MSKFVKAISFTSTRQRPAIGLLGGRTVRTEYIGLALHEGPGYVNVDTVVVKNGSKAAPTFLKRSEVAAFAVLS